MEEDRLKKNDQQKARWARNPDRENEKRREREARLNEWAKEQAVPDQDFLSRLLQNEARKDEELLKKSMSS